MKNESSHSVGDEIDCKRNACSYEGLSAVLEGAARFFKIRVGQFK